MPRKAIVPAAAQENIVAASGYKIKYQPYGAAKEIFTNREDEILMAGPKGTGKSLGMLHKLHLVLSKYPGSRGFMCRKTRTSMTNSCLAMFQKMILKPQDKVHFLKQDQVFNYPNESMLAVIGLDNVDRLNSSEWDIGYMQEATEATENDWEICTACIRHGVVPYQQMMGDCNPDKPTHWLKVRCDKGLTKMFLSFHEDNPKFFDQSTQSWTVEGQRYMAKLQRLSGVRFKRLYKGEWAAAEGIVYDAWDTHVHLISRNELPQGWEEWPHYWGIDFGFTHPFVWQDWMEDPQGRLYLNREIYRTKMLVEDAAREILSINQGLPVPQAIICDHDAEGRAVLQRHLNMPTFAAFKSIQPGVQAVQRRLLPDWEGRPGILVLRDALISVDEELKDTGAPYSTEGEFDGYVWDQRHNKEANSKKDELPLDKDNHGMDALRYIVAFVDSLADDPEEFEDLMVYTGGIEISPF
jgi:PBSX family phage terminase large subunit